MDIFFRTRKNKFSHLLLDNWKLNWVSHFYFFIGVKKLSRLAISEILCVNAAMPALRHPQLWSSWTDFSEPEKAQVFSFCFETLTIRSSFTLLYIYLGHRAHKIRMFWFWWSLILGLLNRLLSLHFLGHLWPFLTLE